MLRGLGVTMALPWLESLSVWGDEPPGTPRGGLVIVQEIFGIVQQINTELGTTILLVEQNARLAMSVAHYAYLMENGRVVLDGTPAKLRENQDVQEFYLGLTKLGQRKSYRDVKHYKRRKRWLS